MCGLTIIWTKRKMSRVLYFTISFAVDMSKEYRAGLKGASIGVLAVKSDGMLLPATSNVE